MMHSRFQLPPRPSAASQRALGGPPAASTLLSLPFAKKPMARLSGDQNGNEAPFVLSRRLAVSASSGRTQSWVSSELSVAGKTARRLSGESAIGSRTANVVPSRGSKEKDF